MGIFASKILYENEKDLKKYIFDNFIRPAYIQDIQDTLEWRYKWRKIGDYLIVISQLLTILAAILAFSDSYFQIKYLAFISGCLSLLAVFSSQRSDSAYKASETCTKETNIILKDFGMHLIPNIINDDIVENKEEKQIVIDIDEKKIE
jgi:hypothetical protein